MKVLVGARRKHSGRHNPRVRIKRRARKVRRRAVHPSWTWFENRYRAHVPLPSEAIYALPRRLIDAICTHAPEFLAARDERFEREFSTRAGTGFFLGWLIPAGQGKDWRPVVREAVANQLLKRTNQLRSKLAATLQEYETKTLGRHPAEIERHKQLVAESERSSSERGIAYIGWLATESAFRREVEQLRAEWEPEIAAIGRFPEIPLIAWGTALTPASEFSNALEADFRNLYYRWQLERMATWDLPIPLRAQIVEPTLYRLDELSDAGVVGFSPWYAFRDKGPPLPASDVHNIRSRAPKHMKPWLNARATLGHKRCAQMLQLFLFWELAIKQRYGDRLYRHTEKLDKAFAHYLSPEKPPTSESVKKIRTQLSQRLRPKNVDP